MARLYTSVIPENPEKWLSKESWATDMSPTTIFTLPDTATARAGSHALGGGGVPGVVGWWEAGWVPGGVLPGYYPGPIFSHILVNSSP